MNLGNADSMTAARLRGEALTESLRPEVIKAMEEQPHISKKELTRLIVQRTGRGSTEVIGRIYFKTLREKSKQQRGDGL